MGCCWMSCDFTVETEEDNSEGQQEDKIELEMSWSDKTRTTRNAKTCLRMGQRKLLTDSEHYGKLSLGIWNWLIMTLKCPLHLLGGALHHTTALLPKSTFQMEQKLLTSVEMVGVGQRRMVR